MSGSRARGAPRKSPAAASGLRRSMTRRRPSVATPASGAWRLCVVAILVFGTDGAAAQVPAPKPNPSKQLAFPATMKPADAAPVRDQALAWLIERQRKDGSWAAGVITGLIDSHYSVASFYDWKLAANALAIQALATCPETPKRRAALDRALRWFTKTRLPKRGSDWDNDTMWAVLYGVDMCVQLAGDARFQDGRLGARIRKRGRELLDILLRNQVPTGGWAYYDNRPYSRRPKWGTSFCTALILPPLQRARELGWLTGRRPIERALAYVRRCRLPNGAYEYDLNPIPRAPAGEHINDVKGSLGRIQVCNWALRAGGDERTTDARIRKGLTQFFAQHRFLDIARMRPIPHEAYYANAGYFYFFGHYYAARVIEQLPKAEREAWHAQLRPHIVKTQRKDHSFCDFLGQDYLVVACTAYAILTLQLGLE